MRSSTCDNVFSCGPQLVTHQGVVMQHVWYHESLASASAWLSHLRLCTQVEPASDSWIMLDNKFSALVHFGLFTFSP